MEEVGGIPYQWVVENERWKKKKQELEEGEDKRTSAHLEGAQTGAPA